jgi:spore germination cell wall hydrolase CwlJ-like protein
MQKAEPMEMSVVIQTALATVFRSILSVIGLMIVMGVLYTATTAKITRAENDFEQANGYQFASAENKTRQLECLARNIYHEAATEPFEGKVAVAQVTMNRVDSGKFGRDVCETVYQRNMIGCQFSWVCTGVSKIKPVYAKLYAESEEVAKKVLFENFRLPGIRTAMYYHADYINPGWKKPKLTQIGHHIFYKE